MDPRDLGITYSPIPVPERFLADDSQFIFPGERPGEIEVYRGPHMGPVPLNTPLPKTFEGEATIKLGDRVTTDHIVPGGSRLKYRSNPAKYAEFVFEAVDPSFYDRASRIRDEGRHNVIVAGLSYGQGSSREQAALCPMYLGIKAVVAKSIERIHKANLVNYGIVPFTFVREKDYEWIEQGDELEMPEIKRRVLEDNTAVIIDKTQHREFEVCLDLSERERAIIAAGGTLPYIKGKQVRQ
jgi:aconitate hydratase